MLLVALPALAVFNEKDLGRTLSVLRFELSQEHQRQMTSQERIKSRHNLQHMRMVQMIKKCNELSLMLYSQNQDCTLDMTYALGEVTQEYEDFNARRLPFDEIVLRLDQEIDRYSRLIESLRRLPPEMDSVSGLPDSLAYRNDSLSVVLQRTNARQVLMDEFVAGADSLIHNHDAAFVLDEQGQADRDSCIAYALSLLQMYSEAKEHVESDNDHYTELSLRLKESYDYAQDRYRSLQKKMFTQSQSTYFRVLATLPSYCKLAFEDAREKYTRTYTQEGTRFYSEWRGPVVAGFICLVILYLAVASLLSLLVIKLLKRRFKFMATEDFRKRQPAVVVLCAIVLFTIGIWILPNALDNNFFRVSSGLLMLFSWLAAIVMLSLLVRLRPDSVRPAMKLYMPIIVLGLLVITMRIVFIPNRMMTLLIPPLSLGAFVWQLLAYRRFLRYVDVSDKILNGISLGVLFAMTVMSWMGYVFLSMQVVIWWMFQLGGVGTVTALYSLLSMYERRRISSRLGMDFSKLAKSSFIKKGEFIRITWFHDFIDIAFFPILAVLTVPLALRLALGVFDLSEIYSTIVNYSVFNLTNKDGAEILKFTMHNVITIVCLFFLFKYICYLIRALYINYRLAIARQKEGNYEMYAGQINFTLSNNVIGILVWGTYVIVCILLLNIPVGALSLVAAGLATGLGLAMKDILNNFIYGIQLMSGRLRVGDWVECDGIRGKVVSINYQSTQIETVDGAIMSFLNTSLFNKNFKNLTRNNPYELVKIIIGVAYGTEVEKARQVILDALAKYTETDVYGRPGVDARKGVTVVVDDLGESSVNIAVKVFVLVSLKAAYIAAAKELIYDALNENGIQIPFPQRDVHIIQ